jgi:hypothetical protein
VRGRIGTVLEDGEPEVVRRVSAEAVPGIVKEGVLLDVHPRAPAAAGAEGPEGSGIDEGVGTSEVARPGQAALRLWNLLHKAREMPKEDFRREVAKELTGREEEPSELIYSKVYKSQIPVIEQAIETAALMLGTDKSRGSCLEMIFPDFLAGAHLDNGNPEILLNSISRLLQVLARRTAAGFPRKPA